MAFTAVLKKAFPYISAAASLGGPLGVMAANAVGAAIGAGKTKPNPTEDDISSAISNAFVNPEQRAALLKAEQDFQTQMTQLGYQNAQELESIAEKDRENARQREEVTHDSTNKILAFSTLAFSFGIFGFYFRYGVPSNVTAELVGIILGICGSAITQILAYYFGSSSGSAAKTDTIAAVLRKG